MTFVENVQLVGKVEAWFTEALAQHRGFVSAIRDAKGRAFECGVCLLNAQAETAGRWEDQLATYKEELPRRTAFSYMRFTKDMLAWAQLEHARAKGENLIALAREMVMQSSVPFLELCREAAGILRPLEGGGRRSEKHARGQLFFNFEFFSDTLVILSKGGRDLLRAVPMARLQADRQSLSSAADIMDAEIAARELKRFCELRAGLDAAEEAGAESWRRMMEEMSAIEFPESDSEKNFPEANGVITPEAREELTQGTI